ncbi:ARM repeat superfamily protein isoform 2 [Hibiscus syriacus]|uniref:ARM repeat superfamily protein isoform 2 n=1 Tax=Hibiscus syriacus TaxID=106335 RepID=A0A6A3A1J4_HIBSY|nr:importin-11-like [Hibiscus syriacus]KAE8697696.1 ARM repeat superfamily protein isoform 2 [Hibiscus syriacus]
MASVLRPSPLAYIYSWLAKAMDRDESVRKPAEAALFRIERMPGFYSCLMEVITMKSSASRVEVRLMACVYLKNRIDRFWRQRRDSPGISNNEKLHLRKKLFSHLKEDNYKIAEMLALIISKIAHFDYPREWPDLFSFLATQLQSADVLTSHRIFMILFRTLKELSKKHLTADQMNFAEISCYLFEYCWNLWQSDVRTILHGFSTITESCNSSTVEQNHDDLYLICERWLFCLKVICHLVISGFQSDADCVQEVRPVKDVCPVLLGAAQSLLPYYESFQNSHPKFWDFIKRACPKLMKILDAIQQRHPYSFGDKSVIQPVLNFCLNKITDPELHILSFEQFLIKCMIMIKSVLECKQYKPRLTGWAIDDNHVAGVLTSFLPKEQIVLFCTVLIRRYLVLTKNDLEEWSENPEVFYHEQDLVQGTEKLRTCAESLYIVLFESHSQLLAPVVVSILHEVMNGCPTSVTEFSPGLLLKEAAYGAAAHVYYELSNYLSFHDWFNGALFLELSNGHTNTCIIRRRVALLLEWVPGAEVGTEIQNHIKRVIYCALVHLLEDRDLAVRLAACRSLCLHVEDANFSESGFSDLFSVCWASCFKLVDEVQEFDSKVQVFNLISLLLGYFNEVIPYANNMMQFFQMVWEESSGESLLQIQLLITLRNFVNALGYHSPCSYGMLLPILQKVIDINDPDKLDLLDDGMLLWETTVYHAPAMVSQLLALFPGLVKIVESNFDHLEVAVKITEGYILLGGREFFNLHASSVAELLDLFVGDDNDRTLLSALPVIDILIQCYPAEVLPLINTTLQKLLVICLSVSDDGNPLDTAIKASSAAILARILVMNRNYLALLTSQPSLSSQLQQAGVSVEYNILLSLADTWLEQVDNVYSSSKKIFGLALSVIMTLQLPQVLYKLDRILSVCSSMILGGTDDLTMEESSGDGMSSSRSHGEGSLSSKELRRRQIKAADPINQMSVENAVRYNLGICAEVHKRSFYYAIGRMHPAALAQLKQALKIP